MTHARRKCVALARLGVDDITTEAMRLLLKTEFGLDYTTDLATRARVTREVVKIPSNTVVFTIIVFK